MKKIIDDRGRLLGFISVIDVLVIAVVIVLAVVVYVKTGRSDSPLTTVNTVPVTYTVYINVIRETSAELLRPGDKLYTDSGTFIGVITDAKITDAVTDLYLIDGTGVSAPVEDRSDVILTVQAECSVSNGRYYADRTYELNAGTEQKLCTKYNYVKGTITDVKVEA